MKLEGDFSQLKTRFGIPDDYPAPNYAASWNVAPTDQLPIVRCNPKTGSRTLDLMRWGLIPYWAKDIKIGYSTFNVRCEEADFVEEVGLKVGGTPDSVRWGGIRGDVDDAPTRRGSDEVAL